MKLKPKTNMKNTEEQVVVEKRKVGRPKGKKVDWSRVTGRDWQYKSNAEIAVIADTSTVNVFLKRKKLNELGAAKYRGKKIRLGRPPMNKAK